MIDPHNLGTFNSFEEVWDLYPSGGCPGDYVTVVGVVVRWNEGQRIWGDSKTFQQNIKYERIDGNVEVTGDLKSSTFESGEATVNTFKTKYIFIENDPYSKIGHNHDDLYSKIGHVHPGLSSEGVSNNSTHADKAHTLDDDTPVKDWFVRKDIPDKVKEVLAFEKGLISDEIISTFFTSGRLGSGFKIWVDESGKTHAEFDKVLVRDEFVANKLTIADVTSVGGQILITVANMNCCKVDDLTDSYRCYFKTDSDTINNRFKVGDQAICQTFNSSGQKYYWRLVTAVGSDYIDLSKADCDGTSIPFEGDEIIQYGNRTDTDRQNAILISAYGSGPSIKQYAGIKSYSFVDCEKTVISDKYNKFTGDFYLETGESIAALFKVQENLIYSEVSSVRKETNETKNLLQNGSFTNDTLYWITVSNIKLFTIAGKLLSFNNNFYGDQNRLIEISKDGSIFNIHIKNIAIKQYNSYIAKPEKVLLADGTYANPTCIISFRYKCISAGNLKVGFEGTPLYFEQSLSVTEEYTQLELTGTWDLTGDFLLSFDGEIMLYDLALRNDKMEDFQVFTNSKITQTSESIEAAVSRINNIENAESSWLTTAVGTKILASLVFNDTAKTPLQSLFEITAEYIKLKSEFIKLEGLVTANNNFIIHENGRIETNEATINGSIATPFSTDYTTTLVEGTRYRATLSLKYNFNYRLAPATEGILDVHLPNNPELNGTECNLLCIINNIGTTINLYADEGGGGDSSDYIFYYNVGGIMKTCSIVTIGWSQRIILVRLKALLLTAECIHWWIENPLECGLS